MIVMARDALKLAKDLIDVRKLSLEAATETPFLTADTPEDKFFVVGTSLWNGMYIYISINNIIFI